MQLSKSPSAHKIKITFFMSVLFVLSLPLTVAGCSCAEKEFHQFEFNVPLLTTSNVSNLFQNRHRNSPLLGVWCIVCKLHDCVPRCKGVPSDEKIKHILQIQKIVNSMVKTNILQFIFHLPPPFGRWIILKENVKAFALFPYLFYIFF